MPHSEAECRIQQVIAVGAAYQPLRDTREVLSRLFAVGMALGGSAALVYAAIADRLTDAAILLVVGAFTVAVLAAAVPWRRLRKHWLLTLYWTALLAISAAVRIFELPTLVVLYLVPMMALTSYFWESPPTLIVNLTATALLFAVPVLTGGSSDQLSMLIITLPALLAVALLAGGLAARFTTMRHSERGRYKATIEALSAALTARDGYTGEHSEETLGLVTSICQELRLSGNVCDYVADVALLHDIGKIGIPNEILHEPGRLNEQQWEVMKQHPVIGERIVVTIPGLEEVARAIRHEHERWDGAGYPDGLKGGDIPLASRIVLVCDAFHAMTSNRPYRKAMSVGDARLELSRNAGTQFDPTIVGSLLHVLDNRTAREGQSRLRPPRNSRTGPSMMAAASL